MPKRTPSTKYVADVINAFLPGSLFLMFTAVIFSVSPLTTYITSSTTVASSMLIERSTSGVSSSSPHDTKAVMGRHASKGSTKSFRILFILSVYFNVVLSISI